MAKKGHHGGAWKVAYADFVTAMMALFIVLWLSSQDQRIKEAVQRAFAHPFSSVTKESVGVIPNKDTQAMKNTTGNFDSASAVELTMLRRMSQDLLKGLQTDFTEKDDDSVKLQLNPEGVTINVFDRNHKPIFEAQSTKFTTYGNWVFSTLAWEIARSTNFYVELEGHTEAGLPAVSPEYGDWEISADRANAVRRKLVDSGVSPTQIIKVIGFADTVPMADSFPSDEINRRVTVQLNLTHGNKKV